MVAKKQSELTEKSNEQLEAEKIMEKYKVDKVWKCGTMWYTGRIYAVRAYEVSGCEIKEFSR